MRHRKPDFFPFGPQVEFILKNINFFGCKQWLCDDDRCLDILIPRHKEMLDAEILAINQEPRPASPPSLCGRGLYVRYWRYLH